MSQADLNIGRLPPELEQAASDVISRLAIADTGTWRKSKSRHTDINIFNLASVGLFTDHVAKLEGFPGSGAAMQSTRFLHLPWWQTSVWLPLNFQPPRDPLIDMEGWPVFLGTCQGLLNDLAEVRKLSDMGLGTTPPGYDKMRANYIAFIRSHSRITDERRILQWVWKGLHDGAKLALEGSALMLNMA